MSSVADFWERCPLCRGRLAEASLCPRCGLDFSPMLDAADGAVELAELALADLGAGRLEDAFWHALQAVRLHRTPVTLRAFALAALAQKRFDLAVSLWQQVRELSGAKEGV